MRLNIADFKGFKASLLSAIADIAALLKDKTDNIPLSG